MNTKLLISQPHQLIMSLEKHLNHPIVLAYNRGAIKKISWLLDISSDGVKPVKHDIWPMIVSSDGWIFQKILSNIKSINDIITLLQINKATYAITKKYINTNRTIIMKNIPYIHFPFGDQCPRLLGRPLINTKLQYSKNVGKMSEVSYKMQFGKKVKKIIINLKNEVASPEFVANIKIINLQLFSYNAYFTNNKKFYIGLYDKDKLSYELLKPTDGYSSFNSYGKLCLSVVESNIYPIDNVIERYINIFNTSPPYFQRQMINEFYKSGKELTVPCPKKSR